MAVLHDVYCKRCDAIERDLWVSPPEYPACPDCGGRRTFAAFIPKTDVYGAPVWSDSAGCEVGSTRERDKIMRESPWGFVPCGDRVGGARNEDHLHLGKRFAYPGQVRRSTNL